EARAVAGASERTEDAVDAVPRVAIDDIHAPGTDALHQEVADLGFRHWRCACNARARRAARIGSWPLRVVAAVARDDVSVVRDATDGGPSPRHLWQPQFVATGQVDHARNGAGATRSSRLSGG